MTDENNQQQEPNQFQKAVNKVKEHKKPLLTVLLAGTALAAVVKLFGPKADVKVGLREIQNEQLDLAISNNDLYFVNGNTREKLYRVKHLEATDSREPKQIDWRNILDFDLCPDHEDEFIMLVKPGQSENDIRHAKYFICERV